MITFRMAVGLVILVAFFTLIGWLIWRSLKNSVDPARLLFRYILTVILMVGGVFVLNKTAGGEGLEKIIGVFVGMFLALALVFLWGTTILGKIGEQVGNLFTGG